MWVVAAVALIASACGNDDTPELDTSSVAPTATPDDVATVPQEDSDQAGGDETQQSDQADADSDGTDPQTDQTEAGPEPEPEEAVAPGGGEAIPTPTQGPISGDPSFTTASKLSTVGLDAVFFGDPVDEAATKAETEWVGLPPAGSSPQCYTVQPSGGPAGIVFTVLNGRIERVDITTPDITTLSGAGVGSTQAQLFDLFGERLEETEFETGSDIMFVPADADDRDFRIIWTTDGLATVKMRAGRIPGVLTDAPCG